jgi:hypothetical protein
MKRIPNYNRPKLHEVKRERLTVGDRMKLKIKKVGVAIAAALSTLLDSCLG